MKYLMLSYAINYSGNQIKPAWSLRFWQQWNHRILYTRLSLYFKKVAVEDLLFKYNFLLFFKKKNPCPNDQPCEKIEHSNLNATPIGGATDPQKRVYSWPVNNVLNVMNWKKAPEKQCLIILTIVDPNVYRI